MRRTRTTLAVAVELLATPGRARWGYELADSLGMDRGSANYILARMAKLGWLVDYWESDAIARPKRHYYRMTELGQEALTDLVTNGETGAYEWSMRNLKSASG